MQKQVREPVQSKEESESEILPTSTSADLSETDALLNEIDALLAEEEQRAFKEKLKSLNFSRVWYTISSCVC